MVDAYLFHRQLPMKFLTSVIRGPQTDVLHFPRSLLQRPDKLKQTVNVQYRTIDQLLFNLKKSHVPHHQGARLHDEYKYGTLVSLTHHELTVIPFEESQFDSVET